jgi:hypothetical protein
VWIPVIAAGVGAVAALIVGVITNLWTGHRDKIRWQNERTEREQQWGRERDARQQQWQREDNQRWLQTRQQMYARLIAEMHDWDDKLLGAVTSRRLDAKFPPYREIDKSGIQQARQGARETSALVEFMSQEKVAGPARTAVVLRRHVELLLDPKPGSEDVDIAELDKNWDRAQKSLSTLTKAMRDDLGLTEAPGTLVPAQAESPPAAQAPPSGTGDISGA